MLKFDFPEKVSGIVSPTHFVYDFSTKRFLMLYSVKVLNFIVRFPLCFEILGNICIEIVRFPGCDVIYSEINLIFVIKPILYYMIKNSRQIFENPENEKIF